MPRPRSAAAGCPRAISASIANYGLSGEARQWLLPSASSASPVHHCGCRAAALEVAERDAALAQVIRRQLEGDIVAGKDADVMFAHLAARVGDELVAVVQR